ncbi:MAG: hypothetical protein WC352_01320 [Candidatus Omnitrophota bacterium]|jgi:hypothetical protein
MEKNLDYLFDEYLKSHQDQVVRAMPDFAKRLEKTRFYYGRFAIPTFYKAHFLSPKQEHLVKRAASALTHVINTAVRLYFEEGHLSYVYKTEPEAAELMKIDPGFSKAVVFARYDGLLEGQSLKFVKFNCDAPAGAAFTDELEDVLVKEEMLQPFFEEYQIKTTLRVQNVLTGLLNAWEEFGGFETPTIAIVDWNRARMAPEYEIIRDYFESKGYRTTIADPREMQYRGGKLYHRNIRINILYRRVNFDEILQRLDEVGDMIRATKDRAVCMVNPLRARLASTKSFLSLLTNPEYDHFFTETENQIKRDHIPWTRRIADAENFYGHKKLYMIDFLKDEKDSLVLKPSVGAGGRSVTIGRETRDDVWNETIDRALKGDWVVQEYVNVPIMTVPAIINGRLDFAYKKYNFNALALDGKFAGGFVRLSDDGVINLAHSGGLLPSMASEHVADRLEA